MRNKNDFQIVFVNEKTYTISMRKKVLWFFSKWVPITYQEAENSEDKILEFRSFEDATTFIETIAK